MQQEPENLSREELLRVENIELRRALVSQMDDALVRDIAQAHMLEFAEYAKTWLVMNGKIARIEPKEVQADAVT